jgi:hypothetical protein
MAGAPRTASVVSRSRGPRRASTPAAKPQPHVITRSGRSARGSRGAPGSTTRGPQSSPRPRPACRPTASVRVLPPPGSRAGGRLQRQSRSQGAEQEGEADHRVGARFVPPPEDAHAQRRGTGFKRRRKPCPGASRYAGCRVPALRPRCGRAGGGHSKERAQETCPILARLVCRGQARSSPEGMARGSARCGQVLSRKNAARRSSAAMRARISFLGRNPTSRDS